MIKNCGIRLIDKSFKFLQKIAIVDHNGCFSYEKLLSDSEKLATSLLENKDDLKEERIAFLVPSSYEYVVAQWGIWRAGGIAVPLCIAHPEAELAYVLEDTACKRVIVHPSLKERMLPLVEKMKITLLEVNQLLVPFEEQCLPYIQEKRKAMIIYTSGTTGKPKGVVSTHSNIQAQITALVEAWHIG